MYIGHIDARSFTYIESSVLVIRPENAKRKVQLVPLTDQSTPFRVVNKRRFTAVQDISLDEYVNCKFDSTGNGKDLECRAAFLDPLAEDIILLLQYYFGIIDSAF
jgi:hypothetical protein